MTRASALAAAVAFAAAACGPRPGPPPIGGGGPAGDGGPGGDVAGGDGPPIERVVLDWDAAGVDWATPPAPGPEPAYTPPVPVTWTLASGARVVLVENRRLPLVSIRVIHGRAGAREDGARLGLAALTAELIAEGAGDLDAVGLPEAIEQLGARLDTGITEDATTIWLDTLASTLDASLALLADVVRRPRLADDDFERVKADAIEALKLRPQEPRKVAALVFDQLAYGAHPYGRPASGFVDTVEGITLADVRAFWKARHVPAHATIVVAGDVDRATIAPLLERRFAGWKGKALPAAKPPKAPAPRAPALAFVHRPDAPQSVVMIGRPAPRAGAAPPWAAEVVNTAIGGSFASRLNHRLREQLGYTYGVRAGYWRGAWAGSWSVTTSLRTDVTVAGIEEALAIVGAARDEALPADELAKAQQLMTRQLPQGFETSAAIAAQLASLVVVGLPVDWHAGYADGVRAVTAAQARDAAAAEWADLSIVVVGDWHAVGAGLAGLGLPIEHRDAEGKPAATPAATAP